MGFDLTDISFVLYKFSTFTMLGVGGNSMGELLQYMQTLEVPFNINNKQELNRLVELGFNQNTTTFTNSVKMGSHIRAAEAYGVNTLFCDSVEELAKIKKFHGSSR